MLKQKEVEEVKKLIKSGFDLELISFELDIPLEIVRKLKEELEEAKISKQENKKINSESYYKMIQMKQRYRKVFFESSEHEKVSNRELKHPKQLSQKDIELIQIVIETIKNKIHLMQSHGQTVKRTIAKEILDEFRKISSYQLTIEQIEELNVLLSSKELQNLGRDVVSRRYSSIDLARKKLTEQLVQAIKIKMHEVDNVEELLELQRKFISFSIKNNEILVGEIKREILAKISRIQQQSAMDRLRNNVAPSIETVITDLVNGNIDIKRANKIIDAEAKSRVDEKPKTRFSLTEEQQRKQILIQIRTAIIEKFDKYPIKRPQQAISSIQQICGGELGINISTVVRNLIARKEFETAKDICDRFSGDDLEPEIKAYIKILRDEIRNAEISELVLKGINQNETPEKEAQYFELIKKGLEMGNVKLRAISLGKNADGSKNITLADIWPEQIQR